MAPCPELWCPAGFLVPGQTLAVPCLRRVLYPLGPAWPLQLLFPCVLVPCHTSYFILCLSLISQLVSASPGPLPQGDTKIISPLSLSGVSTVFCPGKQAILVTSGQLRFYHIWLWNAPYTIYHVPRLCSWLQLVHSRFFGTVAVKDRNQLRPD